MPELHERVVQEILSGVNKARTGDDVTPLGVAMQGRAGAGKTHLLGAVREKIQRDGGYFFLVNLINGKTFWESTALCIVESMGQDAIGWGTQLKTFLRRLTAQLGLPSEVRDAVAGNAPLAREHLDTFITALRVLNRDVGRECRDTARALVLIGALSFEAQDVGYAHLISEPGDPSDRAAWGLSPASRNPQQIVRDISRLVALTLSPTVIAIDQLDTLFAQTNTSLLNRHEGLEDAHAKLVGPVADGLLTLRDITRRTLIVVSCLPDTWVLLAKSAPTPVVDRFRSAGLPDRILNAEIGQAIIAKRFIAAFAERRFSAPYPTWPVRPDAFNDALDLTPRALLRRVDHHIRWCLDHDEIIEMDSLAEDSGGVPGGPVGSKNDGGSTDKGVEVDLTPLDDRFDELVSAADVNAALDPTTEDALVPALLGAGLAAWIDEQAPSGATYKHDPLPSKKPALHARLIQVLDEATENEAHWGFRAIASTSAIAVISRVKAACTMAGLDLEIPQRRLVLLRDGKWPSGKRTKEVLDAFVAAGGVFHVVSNDDLKVFAALREMSAVSDTRFQAWLAERRPASRTKLFRDVLGGQVTASKTAPQSDPGQPMPGTYGTSAAVGTEWQNSTGSAVGNGPSINVGYTVEG
ncbi:MAG TPA: AAA family ATPase, partial [Micromonosporaceae bacterium]|nr:AAA family ATPase [Micromonosporaceae bacterium]